MVAVMTACVVSMAMPALGAEMTKEEKDQCLLASKNCVNEVNSIQQKIRKLRGEIRKGKRVYSAEEIRKLEEKLKEAEELLDGLLKGDSGK
jgi:uncharacterized protein YlxW (UPF0749 family)